MSGNSGKWQIMANWYEDNSLTDNNLNQIMQLVLAKMQLAFNFLLLPDVSTSVSHPKAMKN